MKSMLAKIISALTVLALCAGFTACKTTDDKCAGGHIWKLVSSTATCLDGGIENYKCEVCKTTKAENVSAYGHKMNTIKQTTPTCIKEGETISQCARCGAKQTTTIPKIDHDYNCEIISNSTCQIQGAGKFTCNVCNYSYTDTLPLAEHNYVTEEYSTKFDGTGFPVGNYNFLCMVKRTRSGKCSVCKKETYIVDEPIGHKFSNGRCEICDISSTFFEPEFKAHKSSSTISPLYLLIELNFDTRNTFEIKPSGLKPPYDEYKTEYYRYYAKSCVLKLEYINKDNVVVGTQTQNAYIDDNTEPFFSQNNIYFDTTLTIQFIEPNIEWETYRVTIQVVDDSYTFDPITKTFSKSDFWS